MNEDDLRARVVAELERSYGFAGSHRGYDFGVAERIIKIVSGEVRHLATFSMSAPIEDLRDDGGTEA